MRRLWLPYCVLSPGIVYQHVTGCDNTWSKDHHANNHAKREAVGNWTGGSTGILDHFMIHTASFERNPSIYGINLLYIKKILLTGQGGHGGKPWPFVEVGSNIKRSWAHGQVTFLCRQEQWPLRTPTCGSSSAVLFWRFFHLVQDRRATFLMNSMPY